MKDLLKKTKKLLINLLSFSKDSIKNTQFLFDFSSFFFAIFHHILAMTAIGTQRPLIFLL